MKNLIKAKIVEHYGSQLNLCYQLGMNETHLSKKINGYEKWKKEDIELLSEKLYLSKKEIKAIFGDDKNEK